MSGSGEPKIVYRRRREDKVKPKRLAVLIDWPYTMIPTMYMESLWASDIRHEPDVFLVRAGGPHQDVCANASIKFCLDQGADEIVGISCDQMVPVDILARLRAHNKDAVAAMTATRQPGHQWLTFEFNKEDGFKQVDPVKPLQRMDGVGAGCMLFKADVFRKIPPPWFATIVSDDGSELLATSDFYFFDKCRQYGVEVWVDATLESPHQHEIMLNAQSLGRKLPRRDVVR